MMQHADRLDDIEAPLQRPQLENVGLSVFDVRYSLSAAFPPRVGETGTADVDGENLRPRKSFRRADGMGTGPATGDENLHA